MKRWKPTQKKKPTKRWTRLTEKWKNYSKKTDETMDTFLRTITDAVGTQLHGMNSTIAKMMEEEDDRYRQISERITNFQKKILDMDEHTKTVMKNPEEHMWTGTRVRQ